MLVWYSFVGCFVLQLANVNRSGSCDDVDDEIEQVAGTKVGKLLQRARVFTRKNLADASALALLKLLVCAPDEELKSTLERIIEEVRADIMELCEECLRLMYCLL